MVRPLAWRRRVTRRWSSSANAIPTSSGDTTPAPSCVDQATDAPTSSTAPSTSSSTPGRGDYEHRPAPRRPGRPASCTRTRSPRPRLMRFRSCTKLEQLGRLMTRHRRERGTPGQLGVAAGRRRRRAPRPRPAGSPVSDGQSLNSYAGHSHAGHCMPRTGLTPSARRAFARWARSRAVAPLQVTSTNLPTWSRFATSDGEPVDRLRPGRAVGQRAPRRQSPRAKRRRRPELVGPGTQAPRGPPWWLGRAHRRGAAEPPAVSSSMLPAGAGRGGAGDGPLCSCPAGVRDQVTTSHGGSPAPAHGEVSAWAAIRPISTRIWAAPACSGVPPPRSTLTTSPTRCSRAEGWTTSKWGGLIASPASAPALEAALEQAPGQRRRGHPRRRSRCRRSGRRRGPLNGTTPEAKTSASTGSTPGGDGHSDPRQLPAGGADPAGRADRRDHEHQGDEGERPDRRQRGGDYQPDAGPNDRTHGGPNGAGDPPQADLGGEHRHPDQQDQRRRRAASPARRSPSRPGPAPGQVRRAARSRSGGWGWRLSRPTRTGVLRWGRPPCGSAAFAGRPSAPGPGLVAVRACFFASGVVVGLRGRVRVDSLVEDLPGDGGGPPGRSACRGVRPARSRTAPRAPRQQRQTPSTRRSARCRRLPAKTSTGAVMRPARSSRSVDVDLAVASPVVLQHSVVELPEGAAGVGDHVRGEPVHRLDLREPLGVVEVARDREGLVTSFLTLTAGRPAAPAAWGAPPSIR